MMQTRQFILRSDPNGLRNLDIPMTPANAVRLSKRGAFPRLVTLSPHKTGWPVETLIAWRQAKIQAA